MMTNRQKRNNTRHVFAEHVQDGILPTEYMTMVRSKDWKLVHFVGETFGQLFDMQNDPEEVRNLWEDSAHDAKKQELMDAMRDWLVRSGVKTAGWKSEWR